MIRYMARDVWAEMDVYLFGEKYGVKAANESIANLRKEIEELKKEEGKEN